MSPKQVRHSSLQLAWIQVEDAAPVVSTGLDSFESTSDNVDQGREEKKRRLELRSFLPLSLVESDL